MASANAIFRSSLLILAGMASEIALSHFLWPERHQSVLTEGLSGSWDKASTEFDARVRKHYPLNTPINELVADIYPQDFQPSWYEKGGEFTFVRKDGNFICNVDATIHVKINEQNRITSIRGTRHEAGCL